MRRVALLVVALLAAAAALAELADVYLKNGLKLRGDVEETGAEVVLRNAAGEVRYPLDEVLRVERVATTRPATRPSTRPAVPQTAPAEEEPAEREEDAEAAPEGAALAAVPAVSKADIQKLRINELFLEDPPEQVRVVFLKKGKQRDLSLEVLDELKKRGPVAPALQEVLTRGQPNEKLRAILVETGLTHADRIDIQSDTEVFANFRRRVLPLVTASCARSGCHGGINAEAFRFPIASKTSDSYAYTVFAMLESMSSPAGKMIDRDDPEKSLLPNYMLPQEHCDLPHPNRPTPGPPFKAVLRDVADPAYAQIIEWIGSLKRPRPDYQLGWTNPFATLPPARSPYRPGAKDAHTPAPTKAKPADENAPTSAPATRPTEP